MLPESAIINSEPKTVPSLYRQSIEVFVSDLNCTAKFGARISNLQALPAVILCDIFEKMASYPALRETLHRELSDPELFMRVFMLDGACRLTVEKCLREASLIGKSVLPEMAENWCKAMSEEIAVWTVKTEPVLELGTYLHEAGWAHESVKVLRIASRTIPQEQTSLRIECVRKILRAEGSARLMTEADETCSNLLEMTEDNTDDEVRLGVYLEVANHNFNSQRFVESDRWTLKARDLTTETTQPELIIQLLQLKALQLFRIKQNEAASWVIRQAIFRARSTFGHHHRRYADTLYTCGVSLLKTDRYWNAIQILMELYEIITSLYGEFTPHVEKIESYLAHGFTRGTECHFGVIRAMILGRRNDFCDRTENSRGVVSVEEIKQLWDDDWKSFSIVSI